MATNSDLTPSQNAGSTGNPQTVDGNVGSTDSGTFQQSAGLETLSQNRPISVEQTGTPLKGNVAQDGSAILMWVFIVVASVLLIMIASSVYKWAMKRPKFVEKEKVVSKAPSVKAKRPQGKKKLSRSKRSKK